MRNLVAKQDISVQNSYPYFNTEMVTYTGIGVIEFKDASNVEVTENSYEWTYRVHVLCWSWNDSCYKLFKINEDSDK